MRAGIITLFLIVVLTGVVFVALQLSDGPVGPLPGGAFRTGTLVADTNVDWGIELNKADKSGPIELQLLNPVGSRITGAFEHEGDLYLPCDLGFLWRRIPSERARWFLYAIWLFKRWHLDAERDGRAILRLNGKLYEQQAVKVTDPQLLETLREITSVRAEELVIDSFNKPFLQVPVNPNDIWFFRMEPRR